MEAENIFEQGLDRKFHGTSEELNTGLEGASANFRESRPHSLKHEPAWDGCRLRVVKVTIVRKWCYMYLKRKIQLPSQVNW